MAVEIHAFVIFRGRHAVVGYYEIGMAKVTLTLKIILIFG